MFAAYAAAKAALVRFTETVAIETPRDGIRINAVAPGAELINKGSHLIDLAQWFLGESTDVQAVLRIFFGS
jgi:NAD(P)-dependent dehydrogenase (short-subunit alcohol dehydrogenase family)